MSTQQSLIFAPADRTIQQRFEDFHKLNPKIYELFCLYARRAKAAGKRKYGIKAVFEQVRWHVDIKTHSPEPFRLSNDFTSRYARLIMDREPDLAGFFELRELRAE